jgi:SAM-dependent methyltransferase
VVGQQTNGTQPRYRIDLGCGTRKVKGSLGVDNAVIPGVDVVADLNGGLPFKDNAIDTVYVYHILEHLDDFMTTMNEIWRVCRHGALVYVKVPHAASSFVTWKDPTHRRGLSIATFAYFDSTYFDGAAFYYYSKARFKIEKARLNFTLSGRPEYAPVNPSLFRRTSNALFHALANRDRRWQYFCERFWGPIVGIEEAELIMRAIKDGSDKPGWVIAAEKETASQPAG